MLNRNDIMLNRKDKYKDHWVHGFLTKDQVRECITQFERLRGKGILDKDITFDMFLTEKIEVKL